MADESDINRSCVVFVVDTEEYSGNFQYELVEYITRGPQEEDWVCCDKNGKEIMEGDNDKGWCHQSVFHVQNISGQEMTVPVRR